MKARTAPTKAARYGVRVETGHGIEDVGIGSDLNQEIAFAIRHHDRHGLKIWVWDMRTGLTVHRIERDVVIVNRESRAAGGGR